MKITGLSRCALNAITSVLISERHICREGHITTGAEIGVVWPQAKGCLRPPEAGRGKHQLLSCGLWRECGPPDSFTSDFWLWNGNRVNFGCFKLPNL